MSTKASATNGRPLPPLCWDHDLPEVVELQDDDGERQWKLATALSEDERAFAPTVPAAL